MRSALVVLVMLLTLVAGCIGDNDQGTDDTVTTTFLSDWSERALPYSGDHDHADPKHHQNLTTPNFEILGHDPLISPHYGTTPFGYLCGDAGETLDGRRLAVVESRSDVGFAIADITDPYAPQWLGELVMPRTYVYDLAVVPDGKHVVLVTSNVKNTVPELPVDAPAPLGTPAARLAQTPTDTMTDTTTDTPTDTPTLTTDTDGTLRNPDILWRTACQPEGAPMRWAAAEDPVPRPVSMLLVDIQDPENPAVIDQRPLPGYGHSVFTTMMDDEILMLVSSVGNPNAQNWQFYTLLDTPAQATLQYLSTVTSPLHEDMDTAALGGHTDGWIHTHPNGQQLAYLVGGRDFLVVDIADPTQPETIGYWTDAVPGRTGPVANLHSAYPMPELMDGRHYTIIGPEYGGHPEGQPSGNVWVIDTTDPTDPHEVAAWTLPHEVDWNGTYMFSNHYLTAYKTTIFVSMYHGGVWALDLGAVTPGEFTLLPSVGVFMPAKEVEKPPAEKFRWAPTLEEVLSFPDGSLVTFDSMSGLYTFRFDASDPAPSPEPWPVEPVN